MYLKVLAYVRFWEDSQVNGQYDTEQGDNIPCKKDDYWGPLIDVQEGKIINWETGKTANINYKVCDEGVYTVLDENMNEISINEDYVPSILDTDNNGFGDYIILDIDKNGFIKNWDAQKIKELL